MLISIIIPVYNAEKFLKKSIESVINQSYENIELILINDGSTDSSEMICDKYAVADNRIKLISQKNSGPAAARNMGLRHVTGDFVFFLDADDFIEKNTIKILAEKYNEYQVDLVMANFSKLENNGEIIKQRASFRPDNELFKHRMKELLKTDIVDYVRHFLKHPSNHLISYCWARLYKISIIRENNIFFNENMRLFEDFVFNLEYLKHTNKIIFVNEPLYTYVMSNNHITASMAVIKSDSLLYDMNIFKNKAIDFFWPVNANAEINHALVHYVIIFMIRSCRQINKNNRKNIYNEIKQMINASIFKEGLRYYTPQKDNSRILPVLMKLKLISLLMFFCYYRANKRYGKLKIV